MSNRAGQVYVCHTLTANLGQRDLSTALFANHTTVLHTFVFTAKTFVVFHRPEYGRTKQTITFRLKRPVINGFRFLHLTERP